MLKNKIHKLLTGSTPETPPPLEPEKQEPYPNWEDLDLTDPKNYKYSPAYRDSINKLKEIKAMCGNGNDKERRK